MRGQYDCLLLNRLSWDIARLSPGPLAPAFDESHKPAVEAPSYRCSCRALLEDLKVEVRTLDITDEFDADRVGVARNARQSHSNVDLTICTHVLERTPEPRIEGSAVAAVVQILSFVTYGAMGKLGMAISWDMHGFGDVLDRLAQNPLFSLGVACLARRQNWRGEKDGRTLSQ